MLSKQRAQFAFKPAITKRRIRRENTDRVHGHFYPKLFAQIRFHVRNHLLAVGGAKQIRFANEDHGARAGLIKRLHYNEIILGEARARVDQNNAKIATGQICDRFLRAGDRKGAKSGCINKRDAFGQPFGRQFHEDSRDVLFIPRIFLFRRKIGQLGQWNDLRLRLSEFDPRLCDWAVTNARGDCRDRRDTDRQHVRLQNVIEQRRLAGADLCRKRQPQTPPIPCGRAACSASREILQSHER